jgi:hypothetical protein
MTLQVMSLSGTSLQAWRIHSYHDKAEFTSFFAKLFDFAAFSIWFKEGMINHIGKVLRANGQSAITGNRIFVSRGHEFINFFFGGQ